MKGATSFLGETSEAETATDEERAAGPPARVWYSRAESVTGGNSLRGLCAARLQVVAFVDPREGLLRGVGVGRAQTGVNAVPTLRALRGFFRVSPVWMKAQMAMSNSACLKSERRGQAATGSCRRRRPTFRPDCRATLFFTTMGISIRRMPQRLGVADYGSRR